MPNSSDARRGWEVSLEELSVVAGVWDAAAGGIDVRALSADAAAAGEGDEVSRALRVFCRRWGEALGRVEADARAGREHLRRAAQTYAAGDGTAAGVLSGIGEGLIGRTGREDGRVGDGEVWT